MKNKAYILAYMMIGDTTRGVMYFTGFKSNPDMPATIKIGHDAIFISQTTPDTNRALTGVNIYMDLEFAQSEARRMESIHNQRKPDLQIKMFVRELDTALEHLKNFLKEN